MRLQRLCTLYLNVLDKCAKPGLILWESGWGDNVIACVGTLYLDVLANLSKFVSDQTGFYPLGKRLF